MRTTSWILSLLILVMASEGRAVCADFDSDLVCDFEDNCTSLANGPNQLSNQADSDLDGYGNACDTDFDGNRATTLGDGGPLFAGIQCGTDPACTPAPGFCELDLDGDLTAVTHDATTPLSPPPPAATVGDWALFLRKFAGIGLGNAPGPTGLACAGTTPCVVAAPIAVEGWPLVGAPGNPADENGHGAVAYSYRIAPHEVTNAEYTAFLNAAAREVPGELYHPAMAGPTGGIVQSGSAPGFLYTAVAGREALPVNFVSYFDALRFVNWLHNGQRSEIAVTEIGAYTVAFGAGADRNPRARFFLPNEDEWYKAAYYDAGTATWFDHATGSDFPPTCSAPGPASQLANCGDVVGDATPVGTYPGSASPAGTFDQAGNGGEWTEAWSGTQRVVRGGDWSSAAAEVGASARIALDPGAENARTGFRVARALTPCDP